jgi:hypothetical protein
VGQGHRVRGLAAAFSGDEEAWRFAPCVAVRLLHTRRPAPKEYDSWAQASVSKAGPLLSAEMERRGSSLLVWRFAFFTHEGRRPRSMTRGPGPSCQRLDRLGARRARFSTASWGVNGRALLKWDSPECGSHSFHLLHPFAFELSALFCRRSCYGLARPSRVLLVRGGTQLGAQPVRMGCASVRRKDPCRRLSPRRLSPPRSSCSSSPTSPVGWRCQSRPSSCCCWRSSASNLSTLRPTSSSRRSSSPTSVRCPWGRRFFRQHSNKRVMCSDLPGVESELSCGSIFCVSFTSIPWYTSMNWSSSNSMRWEAS